MAHKIIETRTLFEGRHKVVDATVQTADGAIFHKEIIVRTDAATVLPYDPERRTAVLVRLPRTPAQFIDGRETLLEALAGVIDPGETAEEGLRREAMEEAGLKLGALELVLTGYTSPGYSTEKLHLFLAVYGAADRVAKGGGVEGEHEDIEVVEMYLADLWAMIQRGEICDVKTFALVNALHARRPELFQD